MSAVLIALGLLMGPVGVVSAADGDDNTETVEQDKEVAQLKLELKLASGRVVRLPGDFTMEWGVETAVEIEADGSRHQFKLTVQRKDEGEGEGAKKKPSKDVSITVGYDLDGEAIIAPYTFDTKVKKREVVRIEGGVAIALTVTPKKIKADDAPEGEEEELEPEDKEPPREKIEIVDDTNDPLGGVE